MKYTFHYWPIISGLNDKVTKFQPIYSNAEEVKPSRDDSNQSIQVNDNIKHNISTGDIYFAPDVLNHIPKTFPQVLSPPIPHPGGSADIDLHKVEVLGAPSHVENASAIVPDQEHPEKYVNHDSDTIEEVVKNNLWYKDTGLLKSNNLIKTGGSRQKQEQNLISNWERYSNLKHCYLQFCLFEAMTNVYEILIIICYL